jgi:hypothetical protein
MKYLLIFLVLIGCSMEHHLGKAIKKGYKPKKEEIIKETIKLVEVRDTITDEVLRVDTIREIETTTKYEKVYLSRQERKMYKDSLKHIVNKYKLEIGFYKDELAHEKSLAKVQAQKDVKVAKIENKRTSWLFWLILGIVLGVCRKYIWQIVKSLIKFV